METILELKDIRKSYGQKEVLKGISLEVKKGEIISVLGPSGCGKSTLLNIIAGMLDINAGKVLLNGVEVTTPKKIVPIEKRDLNMVFQDFALWPHMSAKENVIYGLKLKKTDPKIIEDKLEKMVELLHLQGLMDQYPSELSGGQQQRVAIARALIMSPSIVLLDEPLCNLDVQLRIEMRTEMAQIFRQLKTTVFHVTHDPSEAFAMADRIVIMDRGVIDQIATPQECYLRPKSKVVAGLLGAGDHIKCKVQRHEKDSVDVIAGDDVLECLSFCKGDDVEVFFRAEDCHFSKTAVENSFKIQVIMPTFEGSAYRIKARSFTGEEVTFLNDSELKTDTVGYLQVPKDKLYAYDALSD